MAEPPVARADEGLDAEPIDPAESDALNKASTYMRAVRAIDRRIARIEADYRTLREPIDEDLATLDAWREDSLYGEQKERERLVQMLEQFGRAWKERTGAAPNKMPFGRISLTPPRDSLIVTNNDAFVDWAEGTDRLSLVRYKKEPDKDAIKAIARAGSDADVPEREADKAYRTVVVPNGDGELVAIPGVAFATPTQDSVNVKITEPKEQDA